MITEGNTYDIMLSVSIKRLLHSPTRQSPKMCKLYYVSQLPQTHNQES